MKLKLKLSILFSVLFLYNFAAIHYVSETGSGTQDGTSWANAAPGFNLQQVINSAQVGDQVWVTSGIYYTTQGTDRSVSFSMKNGVAIYGGFIGGEIELIQRILANGFSSVLSGEIGSNSIEDNSYTVIYNEELDSTAILDGFIIEGGNDNRSPTSAGAGLGGGIYNHGFGLTGFCHPKYLNLVVRNNFASWGAGAFNNGYDFGNTEPTYINCVFTENHAYIEAGGMDSYGVRGNASPKLYNCVFYRNTSATNVGAMYCWGGSNGRCEPLLMNCTFVENHAQNGYAGAIIADNLNEDFSGSSGICNVTLQNCILWDNSATNGNQQFYIRGSGAEFLATYSDIDLTNQFAPHVISGTGIGNVNGYPLFLNQENAIGEDNVWATEDDGLHVGPPFVCYDSGLNEGVYPTDITLSSRIDGPQVDMGAYEYILIVNLEEKIQVKSQIYPNPSENSFTFKAGNNLTSYKLKIISIDGSSVLDLDNLHVEAIKIGANFDSGIYFLHVLQQDELVEIIKLVKN